MRVIYLDETGHSYQEPVAAVAGFILNPDKQWKLMADEIERLKESVPPEFRENSSFTLPISILAANIERNGWMRTGGLC